MCVSVCVCVCVCVCVLVYLCCTWSVMFEPVLMNTLCVYLLVKLITFVLAYIMFVLLHLTFVLFNALNRRVGTEQHFHY